MMILRHINYSYMYRHYRGIALDNKTKQKKSFLKCIFYAFFMHSQCLLLAVQAPLSGHLSLTPPVAAFGNHSHERRIATVSAYESFHCRL